MANRPTFRPHDGWQDMAKPFIAAYKAGAKSVNSYIKTDQIIYWYRPTLKSASCDSTDNTMKPINNPSENFFPGRPNGADSMSDAIFVVALLQQAGTVKVSSGANSQTFNGQAGANVWAVNMGVGKQTFSLTRGGQTVLSGSSLKDISANCICGIYNFNAYVGTLPAGKPDPLHPDGFGGFTNGLAPSICQPRPSLGTAAAAAAIATASTDTQDSAPVPTPSGAHNFGPTINGDCTHKHDSPDSRKQYHHSVEPAIPYQLHAGWSSVGWSSWVGSSGKV
ncbi:MAG: hypothetical protein Q9212_003698 [Teloschistes hypoglaucus]